MAPQPRFRADHVGSLLRPAELREAFRRLDAGRLSPGDFGAVLDDAIRTAVRLQEEAGLESITDGEYRRVSYWARFVERVDGLGVRPAAYRFRDEAGTEAEFLAPHVEGRVRRRRSIAGDELDFLKASTARTPKITLPSPATMHFWRGRAGVDPAAYGDLDAFFDDLGAVYRDELADLGARGATYVQIDDVPLAMLGAPEVRDRVRDGGDDPDALIDRYVRLTNAALSGRPAGMTVAMHLCRGNFKGRWLSAGGYEPVAERLFGQVDVDTFFLEYDTPRAGDFRPLRFVPGRKSVMLGLVSTKTPVLEDADALRRRLDAAAAFVDLDRLGVSPQCGFASTVGGNPLTLDDQRRKLALVVEVARAVWG